MKDVLFTVLTDASKRDAASVELTSVEKLSAGAPWYDKQ